MLCVSRRSGEVLLLKIPPSTEPREISLHVLIASARSNRVRLGVDAPPEIRVLRLELQPEAPANV